ncbi:MAG: Gfo/Idh/MocA family protein [Opitutales bacterium]
MNHFPPTASSEPVVGPGEFRVAAAYFDHGHLFGQIEGLTAAGAELAWIYDPDPLRLKNLRARFPQARVARSFEEILDSDVQLVAAAAIPNRRGGIGCQVMESGKDYFTDKCPFTSLGQLERAKAISDATGCKYMVYYSERVHVESAWYVDRLIREGVIGDLVHMEIFGPHRLGKPNRPDWFFDKAQYGGILTDLASHQFDQFLHYARCAEGTVEHAIVANRSNPDRPGFEDVGQASLILANGIQCFSRVNWLTPDGMRGWGDGRTFLTGTRGVIEIRKYFDFGRSDEGDRILIADGQGERELKVGGQVGFPFFRLLILDCLIRTEHAMTQHHAFQASRLSLQAQALADSRPQR